MRSPDTSTGYRVDVCAVFPGPGTTQLWLFPGGRPRLPHLPGSSWGVGIWSGMRRTYPPPLSAFLSFNRVVSKRKSSTQGRGRKRCQELWEPLPNVCLSWAGFFQEEPLGRVSEPALHTDASPLSMTDQLGACGTGERGILFLVVTAGQLCSPPLYTLGNWNGGRGVGGPCRPWMIQPKGAALRLGLLGHYPQSRGLHQPHRPGPFRSPWH